jgi:hypothetical protein
VIVYGTNSFEEERRRWMNDNWSCYQWIERKERENMIRKIEKNLFIHYGPQKIKDTIYSLGYFT